MSKYIECGSISLRDPITGEFLPSTPIYIEGTEEAKKSEIALLKNLGKVFAERMKQYIEEGGVIGDPKTNKAKKKGSSKNE